MAMNVVEPTKLALVSSLELGSATLGALLLGALDGPKVVGFPVVGTRVGNAVAGADVIGARVGALVGGTDGRYVQAMCRLYTANDCPAGAIPTELEADRKLHLKELRPPCGLSSKDMHSVEASARHRPAHSSIVSVI